jgi:acetoin utilization deacetylase AcuC-like enzyme
MKVFHCDHFTYPLPAGHRFPAAKYSLLRERVAAELTPPCELLVPDSASNGQLLRAHTIEYLARVVNGSLTDREVRRIGLPWSPELVERSRRSVGGTIEACRGALMDGIAVNLSGGTHHAFPDHGAGYCIFNDAAVAVRTLQAEGRAQRMLIVDCDVHQGDGTAAIFAGDSSVFTFSIHGAKNFPLHKERSDLDVELPDATGDADYLNALEIGLERSLSLACADLAIYLAGADPFVNDTLGRLALSKDGLAARDRLVFDQCRGAGLPVAVVMGGGYARNPLDTVEIQLETVRIAAETHRAYTDTALEETRRLLEDV